MEVSADDRYYGYGLFK